MATSKKTKSKINDAATKQINATAKKLASNAKSNSKAASKDRKQLEKNLKVAFKDAKQQRDNFGRFIAKLKRAVNGRFVSGNSSKTSTKKSTKAKLSANATKGKSKVPSSKQKLWPVSQSIPASNNPPASDYSTKLKRNKVYKLRNFPFAKGSNYADWINSIEDNKESIDSQLKQGERFVGLVYGNKTLRTYENIESLINKVNAYVDEHKGDKDDLIRNIGIITFAGDTGEFQRERDEKIKETKRRNKQLFNEARKQLGATVDEPIQLGNGKKGVVKRKKTVAELLAESLERNREQAKLQEELVARIEKLEKKDKRK